MARLTGFGKKRIETDARREVFSRVQEAMERNGDIPPTPPLLLRRYRTILDYAAAILIGALVGQAAVLAVFLVFNLLFHVDLNP